MRLLVVVSCLALWACSEETTDDPPDAPVECGPGELPMTGGCCPAGSWVLEDGSCEAAGVPPTGCGEGFEADGARGCRPILPAESCGPGTMAVPGETTCAELVPCGSAPWGDIPVEPSTKYVDGSHNGPSDGSAAQPFATIQEAVDAALPGEMVAIAEGTYVETVYALDKAVRLWGRCPALVEIVPAPGDIAGIFIETSDGTEVHALSLTGGTPDGGILISGATNVLLEHVRIHDMPGRSINVQSTLGETSVTVRRSLVESADTYGMFLAGATVDVQESVVRDTLAGEGIVVRTYVGGSANVNVIGSLIERNRITGVRVSSSDLTVERSVIRDTSLPSVNPPPSANGIGAFEEVSGGVSGPPTNLTVRSTVLTNNIGSAIFAGGVRTVLEHVTVRDTQPLVDRVGAASVVSSPYATATMLGSVGSLEIRGTLVDGSHGIGVWAGTGSVIERLLVRATHAEVGTSVGALGLVVGFATPTTITLQGSQVEGSEGGGIAIDAATGTVEGTLVVATQPGPTSRGEGLLIQQGSMSGAPSDVTVRGCRVDGSYRAGVVVLSSHARLEDTLVRGTLQSTDDGRYGDGLTLQTRSEVPATLELAGCRFEHNARAGVSNFGAQLSVLDTAFECNTFDLNGEPSPSEPPLDPSFDDAGGNHCGCDGEEASCGVQSSGLEPSAPPAPPVVGP